MEQTWTCMRLIIPFFEVSLIVAFSIDLAKNVQKRENMELGDKNHKYHFLAVALSAATEVQKFYGSVTVLKTLFP